MVQVTKIRQIQKDGSEKTIAAADFKKGVDDALPCLCPDPGCSAKMGHIAEHDHGYRDQITGDLFTLRIPDYFRRLPGSPPHAEKCSIALAYQRMAETARSFGAVPAGGAFVFNLNIMTDNLPAPKRLPRHDISPGVMMREAQARAAGYERRRPLSESIRDVSKLAVLLERTAFDLGQRDTMILRDNRGTYTLAEIYHEDALEFFRRKHAEAKAGEQKPSAFMFKPIAIPRANGSVFWNAKEQTILGQSTPVIGNDNVKYATSIRLHFTDSTVYGDITKQIRSGARSFLVYDNHARIDLKSFAQQKEEIKAGGKGQALTMEMHIVRDGQIMVWVPPSAQMNFTLKGMDLPIQPRPARQISLDL